MFFSTPRQNRFHNSARYERALIRRKIVNRPAAPTPSPSSNVKITIK